MSLPLTIPSVTEAPDKLVPSLTTNKPYLGKQDHAFVPGEMLEHCGIEAMSRGTLSRTEISAIYRSIKNAVAFVSKLKANHRPEDLIREYKDSRGKRHLQWTKLGSSFIEHLHQARRVYSDLSCFTPHTAVIREDEASVFRYNGIPLITVPTFIPFLKPHPCIKALIDASPSFEDAFPTYRHPSLTTPTSATYKCIAGAFQAFTAPTQLEALKKAADNSRRNCNKTYTSLKRYLLALLQRYKRLLVVRLDLYYRQPYAQDNQVCTHQRISADRVQFLHVIRRYYPAFVGYAWKLEVGIQRHWHAHMLLCFDGDDVRLDAVIGRRLGDAWIQLTEGQGDYFNCNGKRHQYKHDAIGVIHANRPDEVALLLGPPATYLTKIDYYAGLELPDGARTFGKGQLPRQRQRKPQRLNKSTRGGRAP